MYKTYTVGQGGMGPAPKIDDMVPAAAQGPQIQLNQQYVISGRWFAGAGHSKTGAFSHLGSIGTAGLAHCFGVCAVWNKVGNTFAHGYCAHLSSVHGAAYNACLADIQGFAPHGPWIAVSFGNTGTWARTLADALNQRGIADDHIWIYQRAHGSNTFGVDKFGNFGEM